MKLRTYRDEFEIDDYYRDNHPQPDGPGVSVPAFVTAAWAALAAGLGLFADVLGGVAVRIGG